MSWALGIYVLPSEAQIFILLAWNSEKRNKRGGWGGSGANRPGFESWLVPL